MNYLIYFGIVVAAGCTLTFVSNNFAYAVSRVLEAGFETVEYRLALRAHERQSMRRDGQQAANVVKPFRAGDIQTTGKRSTQQLGIARVAA
ncbi:MAG TPA: hypothetical protein VD835_09940 [Pyrinomonadaceae bacterium]|nr:hypothetical protein [Pyrinomonadaceae bacterium]